MAETEWVHRPLLALAADLCVARRSRDPSPAPSSLLDLVRDCGATIRLTHSVSAIEPGALHVAGLGAVGILGRLQAGARVRRRAGCCPAAGARRRLTAETVRVDRRIAKQWRQRSRSAGVSLARAK